MIRESKRSETKFSSCSEIVTAARGRSDSEEQEAAEEEVVAVNELKRDTSSTPPKRESPRKHHRHVHHPGLKDHPSRLELRYPSQNIFPRKRHH
jgi:hypothetical protein